MSSIRLLAINRSGTCPALLLADYYRHRSNVQAKAYTVPVSKSNCFHQDAVPDSELCYYVINPLESRLGIL